MVRLKEVKEFPTYKKLSFIVCFKKLLRDFAHNLKNIPIYKKRCSPKFGNIEKHSMFLKRGDPVQGLTVDYYAKDGGPGAV